MSKALTVITVLAFVSGILDLGINYAIVKEASGKDFKTAMVDAYFPRKVTPTPLFRMKKVVTPTASPSAALKNTRIMVVTPSPTHKTVLSPVPSNATLK